MLFWILAALLTAAAVAVVLRPLMMPARDAARRADYDLAVYKDQLAEVDRDLARGTITQSEAEAARTEIARRLLAADRGGEGDASSPAPAAAPGRAARVLAVVLTLAVPVAALTFYLAEGSPGVPGQPFAQRDPGERQQLIRAEMDAGALQRELEAERPEDVGGWVDLAGRWADLGRWAEAAEAYGRAVGLTEGDPRLLSAYGEALVNIDDGTVTGQAIEAFERALAADPTDPRAQYYMAVAAVQSGQDQLALDRFRALMGHSPADAPWVPIVRDRITATANRLGLDPEEVMPEPQPPAPEAAGGLAGTGRPPAAGGLPGPTEEQMAAAQDMDPEAQQEMIRGMVEGLAARLEDDPDDLDGWQRLGRSYAVLGEPAKAAEAFEQAAELAPEDPAILAAWADALLAARDPDEPAVLSDTFVEVMERLYALDPDSLRALWFLGVRAMQDNDPAAARDYWERLLAQLPEDSEEHALIEERLQALGE